MASAHITATVQQIDATLNDAMATGNMALLEQVMTPNVDALGLLLQLGLTLPQA